MKRLKISLSFSFSHNELTPSFIYAYRIACPHSLRQHIIISVFLLESVNCWIFNLGKHVAVSQAQIHFVARFCSLIYSYNPAVSFISCVAIIQMQLTFTHREKRRERQRDHFYTQVCKRNAKNREENSQTHIGLECMCERRQRNGNKTKLNA